MAKTLLVTSVGFISDSFDLFVIGVVLLIIRKLNPDMKGEGAVASAALAGSVLGQVVFGFLADRIGRRMGFILTLSLVIVGALLSAGAFDKGAFSLYVSLSICRFILGVGIGGEYPLSATIASESSESVANRGRDTALVFSMQGVGMVLAPLLALLLTSITSDLEFVWRALLAFGAVPGLCMFYHRIKMHETARFQAHAAQHPKPVNQWPLIKANMRTLIGTAGSWFLFDVTFYANGLFASKIIEDGGFIDKDASTRTEVLSTSELNLLLTVIAVPGYYVAVFLIDRIGRKPLQAIGFGAMAFLYFVIGASLSWLQDHKAAFFLFYGLTFFFSNAGPNTTTFVLPSESFPTAIRATCHGLSAAAGKLGAVVGASGLTALEDQVGLSGVMVFCACVSLLGLAVTLVFVKETKGQSLEAIAPNDTRVGFSSGRGGGAIVGTNPDPDDPTAFAPLVDTPTDSHPDTRVLVKSTDDATVHHLPPEVELTTMSRI